MTTAAGLATAGFAEAASGSQPGSLVLTPASGATSQMPAWSTTDGCPAGHQGSAEVSEFKPDGTFASRISVVVNGDVTSAFKGTLDGNIGAILRLTGIKKGETATFAVGCYSLEGGTGTVEWVQSDTVTLSSDGKSYTSSSSGTGAGASAGGTSGIGTQIVAALIAGACGLGIAVAGLTWYRRRNRSQLT